MTRAIVFGGSGLIGGHLITRLLASARYQRVIAVGRRSLGRTDPKLDEVVVDLGALPSVAEQLAADDVYIALGTIMAKAGSREAFYKVDHDYVMSAAKVTLARGAQQLALVSSLSASAKSLVFYSRVKGEVEDEVRALSFTATHIMRPSVLVGAREEERFGEKLAGSLFRGLQPLIAGPLRKYRAIEGDTVAAAMITAMASGKRGVHVYESDAVEALGRS